MVLRKIFFVLFMTVGLLLMGGSILADSLWIPYFLCHDSACSSIIWVTNLSGNNAVFNVNIYDFEGYSLGTNPATTITITPYTTVGLNLCGLLDLTTYDLYPGGFVKACVELEWVLNFGSENMYTWGAITNMSNGAGYLLLPAWIPDYGS